MLAKFKVTLLPHTFGFSNIVVYWSPNAMVAKPTTKSRNLASATSWSASKPDLVAKKFRKHSTKLKTMKTISPNELKTLLSEDSLTELIDVRTPAEFGEVHVENAVNIPLDALDAKDQAARRSGKDSLLYIICKSGARGEKACKKLINAGLENVVNVEGGTDACVDARLSVIRGKKTMSLERQVRIAAGSLILIGVVLGFQQHQGFFGISAFVGAGLVFAGITDWCGMGMLLAKMPWNRA